ncbi:MAG TPA: peptidoglycan-binding protein, partial [Pyrinomonadaceae bacterium]|nr:peptidoglycan-binding protein [Pyrinomonadaceae bacterium]
INSITVHPTRPEMVYIGTNNYGVMVSYDSGKNFVPTNGGYSGRFANTIVADREMPSRIYAATINTATGGGFFFVSSDNGDTWRPSMRNMPSRLITYSILQDQQDPNTIYLGTNLGVYRSTDRGASWAPIWAANGPPADAKKKRTSVRGKKKAVAQIQRRAASVSKVDEVIRQAQESLNASGYNVGAPDGRAGSQTLLMLKRYQTDRHLPATGKFDELTLAALGISRDQTPSENGEAASFLILTDAVNALVQVPDPQTGRLGFLAATNAGLYKSSDPAKGWRKLPFGPGLDPRATCVSVSVSQPDTIWVGTADSGALVSRDGGNSWSQATGLPTDAPVNTIAQDAQRPNYVYVGTKQAFYSSHDGGNSWSRRGGNLPFGDFTSILINPRNGDEIFVGNAFQNGEFGGGVYRTVDAGITWARIDPKEHRLPSQRIWSLAFDSQAQNTLFVGSHSAGVYVVPRRTEALSTASQ